MQMNSLLLTQQLLNKEHARRILNILLDGVQEGDGLSAINEAVIVGQADVHHLPQISLGRWIEEKQTYRSDDGLALDGDDFLTDAVHVEHSGLGVVDNGSSEHGAEDTGVADGEASTLHVLHSKLAITSLYPLAQFSASQSS